MGKNKIIIYTLTTAIGISSASSASANGFWQGVKSIFSGGRKATPQAAKNVGKAEASTGARAAQQTGDSPYTRSLHQITYYRDGLQKATQNFFRDIKERVVTKHYFDTDGREPVIDDVASLFNTTGQDMIAIVGPAGTGKGQILVGLQDRMAQNVRIPRSLEGGHIIEINAADASIDDIDQLRGKLSNLVQTKSFEGEGMVIFHFNNISRFLTEDAKKSQLFDKVVSEIRNSMDNVNRPVKFSIEGVEAEVKMLADASTATKDIGMVRLPAMGTADAVAVATQWAKRMAAKSEAEPWHMSEEATLIGAQMADFHLQHIGIPKAIGMMIQGAKSFRETLMTLTESPLSAHLRKQIADLKLEAHKLSSLTGLHAKERNEEIPRLLEKLQKKITEVDGRFNELKESQRQLAIKKAELDAAGKNPSKKLLDEIEDLESKIYRVGEDEFALWIAKTTGKPIQDVMKKEMTVAEFEKLLDEKLFGQPEAREALMRIAESRGGYRTDEKPLRNLLLVGPPGTGKTEAAKLIARFLSDNLIRFDMADYGQAHQVAKLIGAPPGYVGFDPKEMGALIKPLVEKKEGVLLMDEVNLGHKDVQNIQYALASDGRASSSSGIEGSATNWANIGTTNLGMDRLEPGMTREVKERILKEEGMNPAILDRQDEIIVMNKLDSDVYAQIAGKTVTLLKEELTKDLRGMEISPAAIKALIQPVLDSSVTAREINRIVSTKLTLMVTNCKRGSYRDWTGTKHEIVFKDGDKLFVDYDEARGLMFSTNEVAARRPAPHMGPIPREVLDNMQLPPVPERPAITPGGARTEELLERMRARRPQPVEQPVQAEPVQPAANPNPAHWSQGAQ